MEVEAVMAFGEVHGKLVPGAAIICSGMRTARRHAVSVKPFIALKARVDGAETGGQICFPGNTSVRLVVRSNIATLSAGALLRGLGVTSFGVARVEPFWRFRRNRSEYSALWRE